MASIILANGLEVLVDECDFDVLSVFNWHALRLPHTTYAVRDKKLSDGPRGKIYMHRVILGAKKGEFVDHVNGNGLDNRRRNLRMATRSQNQRNMKLYADSLTGFKGVDFHKKKQRFRARIIVDGKQKSLGLFNNPEEAHAAYCEAALKHFGNFARFR